jgi:hypothetical protein
MALANSTVEPRDLANRLPTSIIVTAAKGQSGAVAPTGFGILHGRFAGMTNLQREITSFYEYLDHALR